MSKYAWWILTLTTSPIMLSAFALHRTWRVLAHEADWNNRRPSARDRVVKPAAICLGAPLRAGEFGVRNVSKSG